MKHAPRFRRSRAFSLVELLLSMTVLTAILLMFVGLLDQTQKSWEFSRTQISQFREARIAFDIITKNLSQATLNAYFEQIDANGKRASDFADPKDFIPVRFDIQSELHFKNLPAKDLKVAGMDAVGPGHALFFQAPLGSTSDQKFTVLTNLMNGRGYFVALVSDKAYRPQFLSQFGVPEKKRYRLMEFIPPTEENQVYAAAYEADKKKSSSGSPTERGAEERARWITVPLKASDNEGTIRPLAENIVAFIVSPREAMADTGGTGTDDLKKVDKEATKRLAPNFAFDSADIPSSLEWELHTLPPLVQITMVAIDEVSADRLAERYGDDFMKKFISPNDFSVADAFQDDLADMVKAFEQEATQEGGVKCNFKVFTSTVRLDGAKWSTVE